MQLRESFEEIADRYTGQAIIGKVDIQKHPTFARSKMEGIRAIPYTQIYWKGKMVEDFIGFRSPNELRAAILRHHGS